MAAGLIVNLATAAIGPPVARAEADNCAVAGARGVKGCAVAAPPTPTVVVPGQFAPRATPSPEERAAAARAALVDDPVAAGSNDLAATSSELHKLQPRILALQAQIEGDQRHLRSVSADLRLDQQSLEHWMRNRYEQGDRADLMGYVMSGDGLRSMFDRRQAVNSVIKKGEVLVAAVGADRAQAAKVAALSIGRLAELAIAKHREETLKVLAATETERLAVAAAGTAPPSDASMTQLLASYQSLLAALAAARQNHTVFSPAGGPFSINTDLTSPSGETVERLDGFLAGTALHDLGAAYMDAEANYHVNARYLVAHSILESAFGRSVLAVDKHNLFGFGADDVHPYAHAKSFASFEECIDVVAKSVAEKYLAPSGAHYAGPTLHGMNVHYASDPAWARKIARLAGTIP